MRLPSRRRSHRSGRLQDFRQGFGIERLGKESNGFSSSRRGHQVDDLGVEGVGATHDHNANVLSPSQNPRHQLDSVHRRHQDVDGDDNRLKLLEELHELGWIGHHRRRTPRTPRNPRDQPADLDFVVDDQDFLGGSGFGTFAHGNELISLPT